MSTRPYTKFSNMNTTPVAVTSAGVKVFAKVLAVDQIGLQATEGDICRLVTNTDAANTVYLAETLANATAANGYPLAPGKDFVFMGPSGVGWLGDVYAATGSGLTATLGVMSF
jgi:hypothetical protein